MDEQKITPTKKGIIISRNLDVPKRTLNYSTWLNEGNNEEVIKFIPLEHSYSSSYIGSVGFFEISQYPEWVSRLKVNEGLLQNHFFPFGGFPEETVPELVGKGLAKKIEFEIAKDLSTKFASNTPIVIGATSDSHEAYCRRIGIVPFEVMTLKEYINILSRPQKD